MDTEENAIPTKMEIDIPSSLKRSSSAPLIHPLNIAIPAPSVPAVPNRRISACGEIGNITHAWEPRTRRFSASYVARHNNMHSPKAIGRVDQLRQEECSDLLDREMAHENKLHSTMRMSQSWEDLSLMLDSCNKPDDESRTKNKNGAHDVCYMHLPNSSRSPGSSSSPSPTRGLYNNKQYYMPSLFKHNLSPSPTRKAFFSTRRSLSPIAVRPSVLGSVKRKFDLVENEPPAKRGGWLIAQSRLEQSLSPLTSSIGTSDSVSNSNCSNTFPLNEPESPVDQPMPDVSKNTN